MIIAIATIVLLFLTLALMAVGYRTERKRMWPRPDQFPRGTESEYQWRYRAVDSDGNRSAWSQWEHR